jgi:hypothetical protein
MRIRNCDWTPHKKEYSFDVEKCCNVEIHCAGTGDLLVIGSGDTNTNVPLKAGSGYLHFKANLDGFSSVTVIGKEFGLLLKVNGMKAGEPLDDLPPPTPVPPRNLLQKMRQHARQQIGVMREAAMNDTAFPGHELDDDSPDEFEEEAVARIKREQKERKEAHDSNAENSGSVRNTGEPGDRTGGNTGDTKSGQDQGTSEVVEDAGKGGESDQ